MRTSSLRDRRRALSNSQLNVGARPQREVKPRSLGVAGLNSRKPRIPRILIDRMRGKRSRMQYTKRVRLDAITNFVPVAK
jgi:hypothetical protein